ncbi:hypothetical protein NDU88_007071 [Pleurodeles waltl]|uniref:Uncharacterized protein n=1 Tax=Pleurodeles waltl TaxID=8319 RepID=A0AAV7PMW7_PLEWA|nr:hypothetical protein NDU88_007071 [Pleurodeles waltl]
MTLPRGRPSRGSEAAGDATGEPMNEAYWRSFTSPRRHVRVTRVHSFERELGLAAISRSLREPPSLAEPHYLGKLDWKSACSLRAWESDCVKRFASNIK